MSPAFLVFLCVYITVMNCNASKSGKKPSRGSTDFETFISSGGKPEEYYFDKFCDNKPYVESVVDRFVPVYTEHLESNLRGKLLAGGNRREGLPMESIIVNFSIPSNREFRGRFTLQNFILNFGNASETRSNRTCMVLEQKMIPLGISYKMKFISISFEYLVELGSEKMTGSVRANVEDHEMWSYLMAKKEKNGTCTYTEGGLKIDDPHVDRYKASFTTKQGFKDSKKNEIIQKLINTFILERVFKHAEKFPTLYGALERANVKSLSQAAAQFSKRAEKDLCHLLKY